MRAKNIAGPGIQIQRGVLVVGEAQLSYPGDLLHEAAYLAVVPAARRGLLDADAAPSRSRLRSEPRASASAIVGINRRVVGDERAPQERRSEPS